MYERMNGNGELTETENVIFYVSYGVLTEFLRMNVILTCFATETATATATAWIRDGGNKALVCYYCYCYWKHHTSDTTGG